MNDIKPVNSWMIKTSPSCAFPDLYIKGDGYIVYFKVKQENRSPVAYISSYKFCGALNYENSRIRLLEFCSDHIERSPNAQIVRKSTIDEHSPLLTFFSAVHAVNNPGSSNHHLTNENRDGIPVYAEHDPSMNTLKIFNFNLSQLKKN